MEFLIALTVIIVWPLSGLASQRLAQERGRDKELWMFAGSLGGPLMYLLLWYLPSVQAQRRPHVAMGRVIAGISVLFIFSIFALATVRACFPN